MDLPTYRALRRQARRLTQHADEAEDLVQDTLLAALQAGRSDVEWLAGTLRRQAAMQVRSTLRRRRREADVAQADRDDALLGNASDGVLTGVLLNRLPPAARRVATLALHGLNADEVRWILDIGDAAFRQRLTSIRKTLGSQPGAPMMDLAGRRVDSEMPGSELQFGLMRRALKAALQDNAGLGTHDADGHLIVLRGRPSIDAHKSPRGGNK
jgi:DNA-directed RNA polymerase specialized sigma24 family protein